MGSYDTLQEAIDAHETGNQGDAYLVDGVSFLCASPPESRTIVPFDSTIAPRTYSLNGIPTRVSLLGFGYGNGNLNATTVDDYSIPIDSSDGHFDLDENDEAANFQLIFSLPFDMTIKSIAVTCGTYWE